MEKMKLIEQKTAANIWQCYREIETAESLLTEIEEALKENRGEKHAPIIQDAFGRKRNLQLGIPCGENSHRLYSVAPQLALSVIKAHIAGQRALLVEFNEAAKIELGIDVL